MGSDDIYIINEEGCKYYDIYERYPSEIKERSFNHMENIKETRNRFNKKGKGGK